MVNKMEFVYLSGGSYCWSDYYYDRDKDCFYEDRYHCGSIDLCEEFYDGRSETTKEEIIRVLITRRAYGILFKYADSLEMDAKLDDVLENMQKSRSYVSVKDDENNRLFAKETYDYFVFSDDTMIIYDHYHQNYILPGQPVDKTISDIAHKLIENRDSVVVWRYDYGDNKWEKCRLDDLGKGAEEYTMGN